MKAYEIAAAFADAFTADSAFTGILCAPNQTGETLTRPSVGFECDATPLNGIGTALTYALHAWVESNADKPTESSPDPVLAHAAIVDNVLTKLNGTGKAALLTALNAEAVFSFRGWNVDKSDPSGSGLSLKTPVRITGTALVL